MPLPDMGSCTPDGAPCTLYAKLQYINSVLLMRTDCYFAESTLTSRRVCFSTQAGQYQPDPSCKVLSWIRGILSKHMCVQTVVIRSPLHPSLVEIVYSHMWWITQAILRDDSHLGDRCKWRALKRLQVETATRQNNSILLTATEHVTVFNQIGVVEGFASAVAKSVDTNYVNAMTLDGNTHVERLTVSCKQDVHADFGAVKRLLESMTCLKEVTWVFKMDHLSTYDDVMRIMDASCMTVPRVMLLTKQAPTAQCPLSDTSSIAFIRRALDYPTIARIEMGATDADLGECGILPPEEDGSDAENMREAGGQNVNVLGRYVNRYLRMLHLIDLNGIDCGFRATYCHPQDDRCTLYRMDSDDTALVEGLDFTQCPSLTGLQIECAQRCDPEHYSNLFHLASEYLRSSTCTIRELSVTFCGTCNRQAYGEMIDAMCVNTSITRCGSNFPITTQEQCQNFARMVRLNKTLMKFSTVYTAPAKGELVDLKCVLNALRHHNYTLDEISIPYPSRDRHYIEIANYVRRNQCIVNRAVDLINEAQGGELEDEDLKLIALVPKEKLSSRVGAVAAAIYYNDVERKYFRLTNVSPDERFQNSDDWRHVFSYLGIQDVTGIEFLI